MTGKNSLNWFKFIEIILVISLISMFFVYLLPLIPLEHIVNEDEARIYYSIPKLVENNSLNYISDLNYNYNSSIFAFPRAFTVYGDYNKLFPQTTSQSLSFFTLFYIIFGKNLFSSLFFYINILLALIILFLCYIIFKRL